MTSRPILPRFYVGVVFNEAAEGSLYIGGERADRFVRIAVEHIARTLPGPEARTRWMNRVHHALVPFMAERDLGWELRGGHRPGHRRGRYVADQVWLIVDALHLQAAYRPAGGAGRDIDTAIRLARTVVTAAAVKRPRPIPG